MRGRMHEDTDFMDDPGRWSRSVARELADREQIGPLSDDHWRVIEYLRDHYLANGTLPVMKHICRELELDEGCIGRLFVNPEIAWRIAGLPDPGEEAKAYMETSEFPH